MGRRLASQWNIEAGVEERIESKPKMQEQNIISGTELGKAILIKNYSLESTWKL